MGKNERQQALEILLRIYREGGYSNLSLSQALRGSSGNGLVTALVYGVIERDLTLSYLIDRYSNKPAAKLDLEVALILKLGLYQLLYLDRVPDSMAVNESVKLCYGVKKASAKGFINGILRAFLRKGKKIPLPKEKLERMSVEYSCPVWLIEKWEREYGTERMKEILNASLGRPPLIIRVNTLKTSLEKLAESFREKGIAVERIEGVPDALSLSHTGNIGLLPEFQEGLCYVQDLSSQICASFAAPNPGERVYDLCAAPGSKSFTMALLMKNQGEIRSFDLYPHKLELIEKTAERLGIRMIHTGVRDAALPHEDLAQADSILCDVPCSGLGIIRRKPEIKYKSRESLAGLSELQYRILENGSTYVKPGGKLIYSTCALSREENNAQADRFLKEHPEFEGIEIERGLPRNAMAEGNQITFFPDPKGGDGFFAALFRKKFGTEQE